MARQPHKPPRRSLHELAALRREANRKALWPRAASNALILTHAMLWLLLAIGTVEAASWSYGQLMAMPSGRASIPFAIFAACGIVMLDAILIALLSAAYAPLSNIVLPMKRRAQAHEAAAIQIGQEIRERGAEALALSEQAELSELTACPSSPRPRQRRI